MKHVIIGAGAAGMAAARTLRELNKSDEILVISLDDKVHSRCMLHKFISSERSEDALNFTPEDFFEANNIQWMKNKAISRVDVETKIIYIDDEKVFYDTLLIASGANSVIPPIGDLKEANNVYGLRHLSDARKIREKAEASKNIVIIGSGLVGLDAAYALIEMGKKVTIVEMADRILPLQMDEKGAAAYQKLFEGAGCEFRLARKAAKTESVEKKGFFGFGKKEGKEITGIVLDNDEKLPCDMVIVAAGVRPAVEFLNPEQIDIDRSLKVDSCLRTSREGVYSAGDVAGLSGIWPNAVKQGEIAAKNMLGAQEEYTDTFAIKNTINFFGLISLSVGEILPQDGDAVFVREDSRRYNKAILRDGVVVGVILQGDISGSGIWQYLVKNKVNVSKLNKSVWDITFADFFDTEENGEYKWAI